MEGFLPHPWWEIWWIIMIPIVAYGIYKLSKIAKKDSEAKPLLALMGAFIFVISALKLPSVFGSSSHPTGSGLAAIIFGPAIASVLSMIALIFQATLLAHGGITTLGANVISMGIVGPIVGYTVWIISKKAKVPTPAGIFLATALSDLFTYLTTSIQLALAFPSQGFAGAFIKFAGVFAVTQIPLAIGEGILAVFVFDFLTKYKGQILSSMKVLRSPIAGMPEKEFHLKKKHYAVLIAVLLVLFITPFVLATTNLAGTDDAASEIISATGYTPWFSPVLSLPESWIEPLLGIQALIGASIIAYIVIRTRKKAKTQVALQHKGHRHSHSHDEGHANLSARIDNFAYTNQLAKVSPATKIFLAVSMLILSVISSSPIVSITVFIIAIVLIVVVAKIPARFYLDLLVYPLAFAGVSCIFIGLFFGSSDPLMKIAFPWFNWIIYGNGVATAFFTFFRVLGAVSALFFLVLTTTMNDLFIILRKIHMPKILVEISLLIYRYIFVFLEVSAKMTIAQKLRLGQTGWIKRIRQTSLLAGNLFIRTLEQGERTFVAMNARGYDGNIRVLEDQPKASKAVIAGIIILDIILGLIALNIIHIWSL
jgi:cobalamin biosynthesis protein CbiM/cobalt ECF transporter T component CbiQ